MKTPASRRPFTTPDGEVREDLTDAELDALFAQAVRFPDLPSSLQAKLRGRPNLRDEGHNCLIELAVAAGAPEQTSSSTAMCAICAADSCPLPGCRSSRPKHF